MGGYTFEEGYEGILPRTLVLVGKTGNGKSATGNSILGMETFLSKRSFSGVTQTSELATAMEDGQFLNVIDTPGLFDSSLDLKFVGKEIVSCIHKSGDGIDAFLVVISACSRFAEDEQAAISTLRTLFGRKIYDYMIIVFTGGDGLKHDTESFEDLLRESPKALQETLGLCGNRYVLFDNMTNDPDKKSNQVRKLLNLVNIVSKNNGGKPYTNEIFTELKKLTRGLDDEDISAYDEKFKQIYEMVESKLKETTLKFEQLLEEERNARRKAEEDAKAAQKKSEEEINELKKQLQEATRKRRWGETIKSWFSNWWH